MGNFIDCTKEIEEEIESVQDSYDEIMEDTHEYYKQFEDYDGNLYIFIFVPDLDFIREMQVTDMTVIASCMCEAIEIFNDATDGAEPFAFDDWSIIKYPIVQGLTI